MSVIIEKKVKSLGNAKVMCEVFDSAAEVVELTNKREMTSSSFHNLRNPSEIDHSWTGVHSLEEAQNLLVTGYQPTVEKLKNINCNLGGVGKRISFFNDVVGFSPIVPLALLGVPCSMTNSYMKPIKSKVINVYYDMTANCDTSKEQIIKVGQELLAAILELEMSGYRFNLYAIQSYYDRSNGADILCTKIKNSNTPLDLKRISFPLTHTAYFRVIGFDWYSRTPKGTYRGAYGHGLGYDFNNTKMTEGFKEIFGENCVVFSCASVLSKDKEHFKKVLEGNDKE